MNKQPVLKEINIINIEENIYIAEFSMKNGNSVTFDFLQDLNSFLDFVLNIKNNKNKNKFIVLKGKNNIFNLGGDLKLFLKVIESKNKEYLKKYGYLCIDIIDKIRKGKNKNITTISFINGEARGGGLEAALSCDIIIAEKGYKTSFPETKMGFFPGMGAFEHLSKRIGIKNAKKIIIEGNTYLTDELYNLNIVDYLIDNENSEQKLLEIIHKEQKSQFKINSIRKIEERLSPISKDELIISVDLWIENIFNLSKSNVRMIKKIIKQQEHLKKN